MTISQQTTADQALQTLNDVKMNLLTQQKTADPKPWLVEVFVRPSELPQGQRKSLLL